MLMRLLDELHLRHPFKGSRRLRDDLWDDHGLQVNRTRIQRLMRLMGVEALHPKARTTRPDKGHRTYSYLLKNLVIDRPNPCSRIYLIMRFHCPRIGVHFWENSKPRSGKAIVFGDS